MWQSAPLDGDAPRGGAERQLPFRVEAAPHLPRIGWNDNAFVIREADRAAF